MSKLEELIQELCPDGVEYKEIGEIFEKITDYTAAGSFADIAKNVKYNREREFAQLIRTTDLKTKFINEDTFVYVTEKAFNYLWRVNLDKESIIMPNVGNCGEVYFVKPEDLTNNNNDLRPNAILLRTEKNNLKYLYYCIDSNSFKNKLLKITSSTGQTKFNKTNLKKLTLPVPPLEVQCEIVRILDKFTLLTAELTAELTARRKQYEYYFIKILNENSYKKIKLGDIGQVKMCKRILKVQTNNKCGIPFYKIGTFGKEADTFIDNETFEEYKSKYSYPRKGDVLISCSGTIGRTVIFDGKPAYFQDSNIVWLEHDSSKVLNDYLFYYYKTTPWVIPTCGTIARLYNDNILKTKISIPTIEKQKEIVSKLKYFDKLCNDITSGIPAEIELNNKRYEYYRDKLLTFKEKK